MLSRAAPPDTRGRMAVAISCGVLLLILGAFTVLCAAANMLVPLFVAPGWTIASAILAVGLGIPHVLIILWLDRNEQEPLWLLGSAWLWGAVMATGISVIGNTVFGLLAMGLVGDAALAAQLTASLSAPPVEELTKGAALAVIYLFFRSHIDNVLDGIIYGAIVGMGFAMMENFMYYTGPFMEGSETAVSDWSGLVILRGIVTGVGTHWCFTAFTGAGFGLMRVLRRGYVRVLAPMGGLLLAMTAHFVWNTFTMLILALVPFADPTLTLVVGTPVAVVLLQVPFMVLVLGVAALTLWHEALLIRRYLGEERKSVVEAADIQRLVPARRRLGYAILLLSRGRVGDWWRVRKRNKLLVQLAFERWHMDKEEAHGGDVEAGVHARRVIALRRALKTVPLPP